MRKMKTISIVLALCVAVVFALWQWLQGPKTAAKDRYRTETLETGNLTQTVSANGTLNPVVLVNVGTQVSGTVKKLYADFNQKVQAGQVLAELDPALLQAQVMQSEANVANARSTVELASANEARMKSLYAQEYATRLELDQAVQAAKSGRAQLDLARAQLRKDRTNLDYTKIISPVSGVVVSRQIDIGQTVAASFQTPTLFQIAQDLSRMQIDSSFAEADIGNIKVGQPVRFSVDAFPNRSFQAVVKQLRLNPTTQQNVVTYDVVVSVDNPEQILLPGMTAYVNVLVAKRENALLVPNSALRFRPQNADKAEKPAARTDAAGGKRRRETATNVYVLDGETLRQVPVKIGISDNKSSEVLGDSLKAGDKVVVEDLKAAGGGAPQGSSASPVRMRMF